MKRVLACIVMSTCLFGCQQDEVKKAPPPPKPVKSMMINEQVETLKRDFSGKIVANIKAELSFQVAGELVKFPVLEGQQVKKDELLAAIETKRFQDAVSEAQAKFDLAKAQFERADGLIEKNFISRSEHDIMRSNMNIAQAALSTAKKNLTDTVLYAPFDGIVAKKYFDNHEYVKAKEPVMSFHDLAKLDIEIQIPEYMAAQVKSSKREKAFASFEEAPKMRFPLTLKEFSSKADPDTQTYKVVMTMDASEKINVLPGMSATVHVIIPDYKNRKQAFYAIPASAVFSSQSKQPQVWLINKDHLITAHPVTVTNLTGDSIKVTKGLKPGDNIVIAGVNFLREGQKVKPLGSSIKKIRTQSLPGEK